MTQGFQPTPATPSPAQLAAQQQHQLDQLKNHVDRLEQLVERLAGQQDQAGGQAREGTAPPGLVPLHPGNAPTEAEKAKGGRGGGQGPK